MIPLFPLKLVVFPAEQLNLHIFELRYRELIQDIQKQNITFGIPSYIHDEINYGTEVKLDRIVKTYPDGQMDIKTIGIRIFDIDSYTNQLNGKLYPGGEVSYRTEDLSSNLSLQTTVFQLVRELYDLMNIKKELPQSPQEITAYQLGHHIGLSQSQEYKLLKMKEEDNRLQLIIEHLEQLLPVVRKMEDLQAKIKMNGHFKNLIPPNI